MFDNKKLVSWAVVSFAEERDLSKQVRAAALELIPFFYSSRLFSSWVLWITPPANKLRHRLRILIYTWYLVYQYVFFNRTISRRFSRVWDSRVALKSRGCRRKVETGRGNTPEAFVPRTISCSNVGTGE